MYKVITLSALPAILVGLIAGYLFGFGHGWDNALVTHAESGHAHEEDHAHTTSHAHEQIEAGDPAPVVELTLHEDPGGGWNVQIDTTNFTFAPEHVNAAHVLGEGHAHIYVDGEKVNRVYGNWYHLNSLSPGTHEISVRLSTNDHKELVSSGESIMDTETIVVPE